MPQQSKTIAKYLLSDYTFLQDYLILPYTYTPPSLQLYMNNNNNPNNINNNNIQQFLAEIIGTNQQVLFAKILYDQTLVNRFQILVRLYEEGVVLLDNIFILQEADKYYFYIVQAYIQDNQDLSGIQLKIKQQQQQNKQKDEKYINRHNISQNISQLSQIPTSTHSYPRYTTLHNLINTPAFTQTSLQYKFRLIQQIKILLQCCHQSGQPYIQFNPHNIIVDLQEQQSVYLAPFKLNFYLGVGDRNREWLAYCAPEILEMEINISVQKKNQQKSLNKQYNINGNELVINSGVLIKTDIWSFGCIILEILLYCSPVFYAVNNSNQLSQIKSFITSPQNQSSLTLNLQSCMKQIRSLIIKSTEKDTKQVAHIGQKLQLILNLLQNCLEIDPKYRMLTTQRINNFDNQKCNKKQIGQKYTKNNKQIMQITNKYINQLQNMNDNNSDSELILTIMQITGIQIKKQLRIDIFIDRKYSIFVTNNPDPTSIIDPRANPQILQSKIYNKLLKNKHTINKTIKIKQKYQKLLQILQKPIKIQYRQQNNNIMGEICANIQLLVLQNNGRRVWDKPIIASYSNKNINTKSDCNAVIKIKSQLISQLSQYKYEENKIKEEINRAVKDTIMKRKINQVQNKQNCGLQQRIVNVKEISHIPLCSKTTISKQQLSLAARQTNKINNIDQPKIQTQSKGETETKPKLTTIPAHIAQQKQIKLSQTMPKLKSHLSMNSFNKINQNLEQICSKWKSKFQQTINQNDNTIILKYNQQNQVLSQAQQNIQVNLLKPQQKMTPISLKPKNYKQSSISQFSSNMTSSRNQIQIKSSPYLYQQYLQKHQQTISMPVSLQCSRENRQNREKIRDEEIKNKIQYIMNKLKIK